MKTRLAQVNGITLEVFEDGPPDGPPIILAHGFPETAHSWRHQIPVLAHAGYRVIAPNLRGYGRSSRPADVSVYRSDVLCADLLGLLDETGHERAVFVGHDWGAIILWDLVRLHPERVRAAIAASVPFTNWPAPPITLFRARFGDRFFYILYFQEIGPAERELEADPRRTVRQIMLAGVSAPRTPGAVTAPPPLVGTRLFDVTQDPQGPLPAWITDADFDHYGHSFAQSGFFGPLSYYRNMDANYALVKDVPPSRIEMPVFFVAGRNDGVLTLDPNGVARMAATLPGYHGDALFDGVGHWVQQEAPEAFNKAMLGFLSTL